MLAWVHHHVSSGFRVDLIFTSISVSQGPLPRKESDTQVSFGLRESTLETEWSASATNDPSGNKVSVSISSSPNAPIGLYSLTLDQDGQKTSLGEFILLFNAWCHSESIVCFFPHTLHDLFYMNFLKHTNLVQCNAALNGALSVLTHRRCCLHAQWDEEERVCFRATWADLQRNVYTNQRVGVELWTGAQKNFNNPYMLLSWTQRSNVALFQCPIIFITHVISLHKVYSGYDTY